MSVGGSSPEAYRVGGSLADIFGLWGEPLKETKEQIDRIFAEAAKAGRVDNPRIWVTFRPSKARILAHSVRSRQFLTNLISVIGATEEVAWAKAHKTLEALERNSQAGVYGGPTSKAAEPQVSGKATFEIVASVLTGAFGDRTSGRSASSISRSAARFKIPLSGFPQ